MATKLQVLSCCPLLELDMQAEKQSKMLEVLDHDLKSSEKRILHELHPAGIEPGRGERFPGKMLEKIQGGDLRAVRREQGGEVGSRSVEGLHRRGRHQEKKTPRCLHHKPRAHRLCPSHLPHCVPSRCFASRGRGRMKSSKTWRR